MTDTVADARTEALPEFPFPRDSACPFTPPPELRRVCTVPDVAWESWVLIRNTLAHAVWSDRLSVAHSSGCAL